MRLGSWVRLVDALAPVGEALALGVPALRDVLDLTTLDRRAWLLALGLAGIPLVLTQAVRILRDRPTVDDTNAHRPDR